MIVGSRDDTAHCGIVEDDVARAMGVRQSGEANFPGSLIRDARDRAPPRVPVPPVGRSLSG